MLMIEEKSGYDKFIENIYTKEQLAKLLDEIEIAKSATYKQTQSISLSKKIEKKVSDGFSKVVAEIENNGLLPQGSKAQSDYFNKLKDYLLGLKVCKMTLSFQPTSDFLRRVSNWLIETTNGKIILDITVSEKLVAGAQIEFEGEYRNFSISERIDKLLENYNLKGVKT